MSITYIRKLAVALLACAFISESIGASSPQIGDVAPDFTLNTIEGRSVRLDDLVAKRDLVLIVLRGWPGYQCPLCNEQAHSFTSNAAKFSTANLQVVMVYPGPADQLKTHAKEFQSDKNWPKEFMLLMDPDYIFTRSYGLRWDAPNETAYPSTFVIAKNRKITFSHVSHGHGGRVKAEAILKLLQGGKSDAK